MKNCRCAAFTNARLRTPPATCFNAGDPRDRVGVFDGQRRRGAQAAGDVHRLAAAREVAGADLDDVGAGGSAATLHRAARAAPERDHGDHRGDADDHAEHGQHGAQAVAAERANGDLDATDEAESAEASAELGLLAAQRDDRIELRGAFAGYQPKNTPTSGGHAEGEDTDSGDTTVAHCSVARCQSTRSRRR